jgi:hypothetical protein
MSDFNALLKRSFAEAHEPADDGFSVNIAHAVAGVERAAKIRAFAQTGATLIAGAAILYGFSGVAQQLAPQLMAETGLQVARAQGVLSSAPGAFDFVRSLGASLPQILLMLGALAGGLVAYRSAQDEA